MKLSQAALKQKLRYDPETGLFYHLSNKGKARIGEVAGSKDGAGYTKIGVLGRYYTAHRLAFLYMTGKIPKKNGYSIDHINRIPTDNRWSNLRFVSISLNMYNRKWAKSNKVGIRGVRISNGRSDRFAASINQNGKNFYLGVFPTPEAAKAAYLKAASKLYGVN